MGDISRNHRQFLSRIAELLRPVGSTRSRGDATPKARPRALFPSHSSRMLRPIRARLSKGGEAASPASSFNLNVMTDLRR